MNPVVTIPCPFCGAPAGYKCYSTTEISRMYPHKAREAAWNAAKGQR